MNREDIKIANDNLYSANKMLEKEIESLKKELEIEKDISEGMLETIDKAIEFIYENAYDTERQNCIDDLWGEIPTLLDILKGSDKEC